MVEFCFITKSKMEWFDELQNLGKGEMVRVSQANLTDQAQSPLYNSVQVMVSSVYYSTQKQASFYQNSMKILQYSKQ